jgi:hypothetical protein
MASSSSKAIYMMSKNSLKLELSCCRATTTLVLYVVDFLLAAGLRNQVRRKSIAA